MAPRCGRYSIVRRLGAGGMGEVFLASAPVDDEVDGADDGDRERNRADGADDFGDFDDDGDGDGDGDGDDDGDARARCAGQLVVVKRVLPELCTERIVVERLRSEARIVALLEHPHIVKLLDVGVDDDGVPFLTLEHVDGKDLWTIFERVRKRQQRMPPAIAARIIGDVLDALAYAHGLVDEDDGKPLGIVHRDISGSNVLVAYSGDVKLIDFGIARARDSQQLTRPGAVLGKARYMAPEQLEGRRVDGRADVYAVGVLLHTLLALEPPPLARPALPSTLHELIPLPLRSLLAAALAHDVDERLAAAAMLTKLFDAVAPASPRELAAWMRVLYADELFGETAPRAPRPALPPHLLAPVAAAAAPGQAQPPPLAAALARVKTPTPPSLPLVERTDTQRAPPAQQPMSATATATAPPALATVRGTALPAPQSVPVPPARTHANGVVVTGDDDTMVRNAARPRAHAAAADDGDRDDEEHEGLTPLSLTLTVPLPPWPWPASAPHVPGAAIAVAALLIGVGAVFAIDRVGGDSPYTPRPRYSPPPAVIVDVSDAEPAPPPQPQQQSAGALVVRTATTGLAVVVDGKRVGHTPLHLDVAAGAHDVVVVGANGDRRRMPVVVHAGATAQLTLAN